MIKYHFPFKFSIVALLMATTAIAFGSFIGFLFAMYNSLPAVTQLSEYKPNVVSHILDRSGRPIAELYREKRVWIQYNSLPTNLINAIVATEDAKFFEHKGVRPTSILRAFITDVRKGRIAQGGSTITQQLAKQLFLTPRKTIVRKVKEALLAVEIERIYTKEEILELYCNQIYLGSGAYGVEAASRIYFGKSATDLSTAEAALIAGLPKSPSKYSPFNDFDMAGQRRSIVLSRMLAEGYLSEKAEAALKLEPINLIKRKNEKSIAPHFVEAVRIELEGKYGPERLYREGMRITTTLDLDMQIAAEKAVLKGTDAANKRLRSMRVYTGEEGVQAALVAIDPHDGSILALVGGTDFTHSKFNRAFLAKRQSGSSFKPFVYAAALDTGFSPADIIIDSPVIFKGATEHDNWKPTNFSSKFYGPVTLRKALEKSLNVASVKLLDKVGIKAVANIVKRLGFRSELNNNLTIALGSSAVTPIEITAAYSTFANMGLYVEPHMVSSVQTTEGEIIEQFRPIILDAIRPEVAYVLTNMLKGVVENGTGQVAKSLNRPVAGKTGTTNDNRDAWFIGYTPDIVAGVWVGLDNNKSMGKSETGGRTAAPIWVDFMQAITANKPVEDFTPPERIVVRTIDKATGKLANEKCRYDTFEEVFVEGTEPTGYCQDEKILESLL
ncbi:MAG TPA: PBP1A family penicillin-binding protein [Nitrospinota bacterium]|nr:PBP1A family penicillin-binding protein [Nitrospinota bacterium]|tara:strand:- start:6588 stop:8594 length:2007 start_codon:yes stop_codon:yes gene_type:complete